MPAKRKSAKDKLAGYIKTLAKHHDAREIIDALRHTISNVEPAKQYSQELADEICERMALGETLTAIVKDEHMPEEKSVYRWRQRRPDFGQAYVRARVDQMHAWSDEIISLADDAEGDFRIKVDLNSPELERIEKDGFIRFRYTKRQVSRVALMIDTRKWLMSRIAPEDFGDKLQLNATVSYEDKDDGELMQEMRNAAEKAGVSPETFMQFLGGEGPVQ